MKQIWRAFSAVASDPAFFNTMQGMAKCIHTSDLVFPAAERQKLTPRLQKEQPDLSMQPDFVAVASIQAAFKAINIDLSVYESCEINRLFFENATRHGMDNLAAYWAALGDFAVQRAGNQDFMALAGALAIDQEFRFDFANNAASVSAIGFTLSPQEETTLRQLLTTNGAADLKARSFREDSWSGSCLQIARTYPGWVHLNV